MSDSTPLSVYHSSSPQPVPSNDDIEAVIRLATATTADRPPCPLRDTRTQLFVGNLPYRVRWQDLKDLFRKGGGQVLRADVSLGPDNRSRGYGTVLLATAEDAGRAIDMFNGYCWQTRVLEVRPDRLGASPDPDMNINSHIGQNTVQPPPFGGNITVTHDCKGLQGSDSLAGSAEMRSLFVGNLPFHIQWQDLKDLFRAAGTVARADVALGPDGRSRGFGTVTFSTEEGAERARRLFDGYGYHGRQLKVHYDKFALPSQALPLGAITQPSLGSSAFLSPFDQSMQTDLPAQLALSQNRSGAIAYIHPQPQIGHALRAPSITSHAELVRSSALTSPAMTSPAAHLHSLIQSPTMQSSVASKSLAVVHSHTLSRPHSLAGSPHPSSSSSSSVLGSHSHEGLPSGCMMPVYDHVQASSTGAMVNGSDPKLNLKADAIASCASSSFGSSPRLSSFSTGPVSHQPTFRSSLSPASGTASAIPERHCLSSTLSTTPQCMHLSASQRLASPSQPHKPSLTSTQKRGVSSSASSASSFMVSTSTVLGTPRPSAGIGTGQMNSLSLPVSRTGSHVGLCRLGATSTTASSRATSPPSSRSSDEGGSSGWLNLSGTALESQIQDQDSATPAGRPFLNAESSRCPTIGIASGTHKEVGTDADTILKSELTAGVDRDGMKTNGTGNGTGQRAGSEPKRSNGSETGNGELDYGTKMFSSLSARRANRIQSRQHLVSSPHFGEKYPPTSSDRSPPSPTNIPLTNSLQERTPVVPTTTKSSHSDVHSHPGPISLPPPAPFSVSYLSPHMHLQSPVYHPGMGYTLGPMHNPPLRSPLHYPGIGIVHSPLGHPSHPPPSSIYGVPYGAVTPAGLPPITPSMPPFTFLAPQPHMHGQIQGQRQQDKQPATGERLDGKCAVLSGDGDQPLTESQKATLNESSQGSTHPPSQSPVYFPRNHHVLSSYSLSPFPPQPSIPMSPGMPLSPAMSAPLSPGAGTTTGGHGPGAPTSGVSVPLTPGVTMTPGAFCTNRSWWNPAVGAPVHTLAYLHRTHTEEGGGSGGEGYFPPVLHAPHPPDLNGDGGYFPPVKDGNVGDESAKSTIINTGPNNHSCEEPEDGSQAQIMKNPDPEAERGSGSGTSTP